MTRNRLLAFACTAAFLGLLRLAAPDAAQRAPWLYLIALPLGYGHVIGAAVFSRARSRRSAAPRVSPLFAAFLGTCLLTLAVAFAWALRFTALQPFVLAPMLLLFGWHVVENDLALGRYYAEGLRVGPIPRRVRPHAIALLLTSAVALAAFSTREGAEFSRACFGAALLPAQTWFMLDELSAGFVLYHTISWLLFFEDRARALRVRAPAEAARLRRRVLAFHAAPLVLIAALRFWSPATAHTVAAPALYFLASAAHALHTAWSRGLGRRAEPV